MALIPPPRRPTGMIFRGVDELKDGRALASGSPIFHPLDSMDGCVLLWSASYRSHRGANADAGIPSLVGCGAVRSIRLLGNLVAMRFGEHRFGWARLVRSVLPGRDAV